MSVGLVLEGGGQRGAYTSGVLQALYSEGIRFDYIAGVSAGALTAISYVSGQPRRNYYTFVDYAADPRYMGFDHIRENGSVFNFDFMFGELAKELIPLDYDAFFQNPCRFRIGTTDCRTGKAVYFDKENLLHDPRMSVMRATASLPLVSEKVRFRGMELMDGGLADPIPINRSIADGNDRNVIVLTRDASFVPKKSSFARLYKKYYADYPQFVETLNNRHLLYEEQRRQISRLEREGKAIVIRPQQPIKIGRYERRRERLAALFDRGLADTAPLIAPIRKLLEEHRAQ